MNSEYEAGNYEEAERSSRNAKTWGILSVVLSIVVAILMIFIFGIGVFAAIFNGEF